MTAYDPALVDTFLAHHWRYRPVDATFMGEPAYDRALPPARTGTLARERAEAEALYAEIAATGQPSDLGERIDRRFMLAELRARLGATRSRLENPAWYTGEAAFGIIGLLLPQSVPVNHLALLERLAAIPDFLRDGEANLAGKTAPAGWTARARREAAAMAAFLRSDIRLHPEFDQGWTGLAAAAARAFEHFATSIASLGDADPAVGEAYISTLMSAIHGLDLSPAQAARLAQDAFDRLGDELEALAATIDPRTPWQDQVAALSAFHPASAEDVLASYRLWDERALAAGADFVTPATDYALDYRWLAPCFSNLASALYFLSYRSPPGLKAGDGSVYWVAPPGGDPGSFLPSHATATVKSIHAVHHGSIGHHTQNSRARMAASRLGRIAGTDCALGLAFLGSGTLVEGWACYVQDLLTEVPGFYTPAETLLQKQFERRNAASVLVDIRLHTGEWSPDQAIAFYRDEAGFAPSRVESEVVRNSMLPGSRLMYWLGVESIKALRRRWKGEIRAFHDTLLGFGHVPVAWIRDELEHAGLLTP